MALTKQPIAINFGQGIQTKADPFQLSPGNFLAMQNSVFTTTGRLTKRNGFQNITALPNTQQTTLTTLNDNLIAAGSNLYAFIETTNQWIDKGTVRPVGLSTQPLTHISTSQNNCDYATSQGLSCTTYIDNSEGYYQINDVVTGQQIVGRVALPLYVGSGTSAPRVFTLGQYFIITFFAKVSSSMHLRYIAIPIANPTSPEAAVDLGTSIYNEIYDGVVANNNLYISYSSSSTTISLVYLTSTLGLSNTATYTTVGVNPGLISMCADMTTPIPQIWMTYYDKTSNATTASVYDSQLNAVRVDILMVPSTVIRNLTTIATGGVLTLFYEVANSYGYDNSVATDYVNKESVRSSGGSPFNGATVLNSVGLASRPFYDSISNTVYLLVQYGYSSSEQNQCTYFLIDSSGNVYSRLAYSNGGGYSNNLISLASVSYYNGEYQIPYLVTDFLASVNKNTNLPTGTPTNAIYTQTGVNLASFAIDNVIQYSSEIAGALHLTGGMLWEFDGVLPVEHGFQVWPENVEATTTTTGTAQTFYYQFTYEWTDNQGNLHRSAPSIPVKLQTAAGTPSNTINVPTLRITYKNSKNPVRIVGYRWSVAQQVYYQFTSLTSPTVNNTTVDYVTFTDTNTDAQILGNTLLYTTGGVIENIAAPACIASALFNNRLWLIDAEDRNLLWYSKQVIEAVPVEMSDLLTIYVAPTTGAQGSTGPMTALSSMDDKLIIFKKDAIYYINGIGPDNTGANSGYSDPTFITAAVGCANPSSIVLMPNGIMFQSDKGIWLLGRDLNTQYIGAPVEQYNTSTVMSAQAIPGTNQVRFVLSSNVTLMYDYFFNQWGTFSNIFAISSTLYQGMDTYLNSYGSVFQEAPGTYIDGSVPVLMSLTTSWFNIAGLQGYERFYFANLLGTYYTPFKLNVSLAYDYSSSPTQQVQVLPDNFSPAWGLDPLWGSNGPWGGPGNVFSARVFPEKQKCESFQVTINEIYDSSYGMAAGQGLTLSGLALIVGIKKGYRTQSAAKSFG
jgi:hypothetical protein